MGTSSAPTARNAHRTARAKESASLRIRAAAVVLVICGLVGWGVWRAWADPTYTTGIGEQRIVRLDDGTRLSLNSGTRVRIAYDDSERRVELESGEAYFEVAHNPARPFIVTAANHRVTALGTVFVV